MKNLIATGTAILLLAGCSTPKSARQSEGPSVKKIFDAPYAIVFPTVIEACRLGPVQPKKVEPEKGFISAEGEGKSDSWGEVVAVWVKPVGETKTEVEVISKKSGPAVHFQHNWQQEILANIEVLLARKKVETEK